jgi:hypothetical protein
MADDNGGADFAALLPEDLRENPSLKDFKDVGSLAKSYLDTKTKIGGMTTVPAADAGAEAWGKLYDRLGRPETADKYELKLPEVQGQTFSPEAMKAFRDHAHETGLTSKQAQANMDWYMKVFQGQVEASSAALAEAAGASVSELRKEWGGEYDKNMGQVDRALAQFFGEVESKQLRALSAANPKLMKSLAEIGGTISESAGKGDTMKGDTGDLTAEDAKTKIKEIRENKDHPYHDKNKPGHLEAYTEVSQLYVTAYDNISD